MNKTELLAAANEKYFSHAVIGTINQQQVDYVCADEGSKQFYYDLASLTKVLGTTTHILQLCSQSQQLLFTPVNHILPVYPNLTMTVRELLLHKSGLQASFSNKWHLTWEGVVKYFQEFRCNGNDSVEYSDVGYVLLGQIIEEIDGETLDRTLKKHVFDPLNLHDTSFGPVSEKWTIPSEYKKQRGLVCGEVNDTTAYILGKPIGSAGIFSTIEDVMLFTGQLINNQTIDGNAIFSKELFQTLLHTNQQGRTLGWEVKEKYFYHTGFTGTSIGWNPQTKQGLVVLSNRLIYAREDAGFFSWREQLYNNFFMEELGK